MAEKQDISRRSPHTPQKETGRNLNVDQKEKTGDPGRTPGRTSGSAEGDRPNAEKDYSKQRESVKRSK